jgi:hypothetical protein
VYCFASGDKHFRIQDSAKTLLPAQPQSLPDFSTGSIEPKTENRKPKTIF